MKATDMAMTAAAAAAMTAAAIGLAGLAGAAAPAADAPAGSAGAAVFSQNCAACHQANGKGIAGAFPALDGDAFVKGPPGPIVQTLLKGRGAMPAFASSLTDQQIAAVVTHIRSAWSNGAPPVTVATVAAARRGASGQPPARSGGR